MVTFGSLEDIRELWGSGSNDRLGNAYRITGLRAAQEIERRPARWVGFFFTAMGFGDGRDTI